MTGIRAGDRSCNCYICETMLLITLTEANLAFKGVVGNLPPRRQLLHAWALDVQHPTRSGKLSVSW